MSSIVHGRVRCQRHRCRQHASNFSRAVRSLSGNRSFSRVSMKASPRRRRSPPRTSEALAQRKEHVRQLGAYGFFHARDHAAAPHDHEAVDESSSSSPGKSESAAEETPSAPAWNAANPRHDNILPGRKSVVGLSKIVYLQRFFKRGERGFRLGVKISSFNLPGSA
jgi:hypothetical protein